MVRRAKGTGSVFFDKASGCWIARVSLGFRAGKRIQHKHRAPDEASARLKLRELEARYGQTVDPATMTLDAYLEEWLTSMESIVAPSAWKSYRDKLKPVRDLLGGIRVMNLRPQDVRRVIAAGNAAGRAPSSTGQSVSVLGNALGRLVEERILTDNPARVKLPKVTRPPVEALTAERARAIIVAVKDHAYAPAIVLLLGSGMRAGEAMALDWRDVDLEAGEILIRRGKTRTSVRRIPIPAFVVASLKAHRLTVPHDPGLPVFLNSHGGRLTTDGLWQAFQHLLVAAELPRMRIHDLRHGYATLSLSQGTPMRMIADQLGHANPSLTARIYAHVAPESGRRAAEALDEAIG